MVTPQLVDRSDECRALERLLDTVREGMSQTLVIRGEPGATVPYMVMVPASAETTISWRSTLGSQDSSAATSRCRSSFVIRLLFPIQAPSPS